MIRRWDPLDGDGPIRYALTYPRDAAYALPRRALCRLFGHHSAVCDGRRDDRHMKWRREMHERRYGATGRR